MQWNRVLSKDRGYKVISIVFGKDVVAVSWGDSLVVLVCSMKITLYLDT